MNVWQQKMQQQNAKYKPISLHTIEKITYILLKLILRFLKIFSIHCTYNQPCMTCQIFDVDFTVRCWQYISSTVWALVHDWLLPDKAHIVPALAKYQWGSLDFQSWTNNVMLIVMLSLFSSSFFFFYIINNIWTWSTKYLARETQLWNMKSYLIGDTCCFQNEFMYFTFSLWNVNDSTKTKD